MKTKKLFLKNALYLTIICILQFVFAQVVVANETVQLKKSWSAQEIIDLGYVPDEVIIKFNEDRVDLKTETGRSKAKNFVVNKGRDLAPGIINRLNNKSEKAQRLSQLSADDLSVLSQNFFREKEQLVFANASTIELNMDDSVIETIEELTNDPDVEYVIPNYVFEFTADIIDPEYTSGNQWGVEKIWLQQSLNELEDIPVQDIVVAVLDTGLSFSHSDEFNSDNLWDGSSGCKDENGNLMNNDGICTHHGWDYAYGDNYPQDDNGHGTHVTGIIGALKNNIGVAGTSSNVKMMIVKVGDMYGDFVNVAKGINFAEHNNAKIINASFAGELPDGTEASALDSFLNNSRLLVAASGNDKNDNDINSWFPASYSYNEIIAVAATENDDDIWDDPLGDGSNYGATQVDIAAPGADIMSTYYDGTTDTYHAMSGTSMAAPFVTGVAAMIMGAYPELSASQVKDIIMESGDYIEDLDPATGTHPIASGNRLNALKAIEMAKQIVTNHFGEVGLPTIHAKSTGGNWSYASMWEENRVPGSDDIVEINGNVTLNINSEISGLIVQEGAVLKARQYTMAPRYNTLTINGHILNHGTIKDEYTNILYYGNLIISASGDLENTGVIESNIVRVSNFINKGNFGSSGITITGDLDNTGIIETGSSITFDGSTPQQITTTSSLGYLSILNDTTINDNLTVEGRIYVDTGKTLSFGNENTLTLNSWVNVRGAIEGGDLILNGADQTLNFDSTFNVNRMIIGGSGIKTYKDNKIINGDFEVLSGAILELPISYARPIYLLHINGNLTNSGIIRDDYSSSYYEKLNIELTGNLENTGTITNNSVLASWTNDPLAVDYEIRFTDTDFIWQDPVVVNPWNTSLNSYVDSSGILWQVRPVYAGEPGDWYLPYAVNASAILLPQLSITDSASEDVVNGTSIDFGEITLETPLQKSFTVKNVGLRNLEIENISLTGDVNYTIELLEEADLILQPDESKTFGINFTAFEGETSGSRQTALNFTTNDENNTAFQISFTGQILMPDPAPVITEVTPVPEITTDKTPDYTFHSTEAGTLSYDGPCQSPVTQIQESNTTITFDLLDSGHYDYCFLTVTDTDGNISDPLPIRPFTVDQVTYENITWNQVNDELALWQIFNSGSFATEEERIQRLEKDLGKYNDFIEKSKYAQAAQKARKAIAAGYEDILGIVDDLKDNMEDELERLKRILIEEPMEEMYE